MHQLQWLGIKSQQNRNKTTKQGNKERATRKTTFLHMSERGRKLIFPSKKKLAILMEAYDANHQPKPASHFHHNNTEIFHYQEC